MTKLIYIAHPYTSHGTPEENYQKVDTICKHIINNEPNIVPISPIHTFNFFPPTGDQTQVIKMCLCLLSQCEEIRFYGPWQNSFGCRQEMRHAIENNKPIKELPYPNNIDNKNNEVAV